MEIAKSRGKYSDRIAVLGRKIARLRHLKAKFDYIQRIRVGILVLGFFSLVSSWGLFANHWKDFDLKLSLQGHDGVTIYERRFQEIKPLLPAQGVVGYVSDAQDEGAEFYLTQYSLAPLIIDKTQPHEFVVGNFANRTVDASKLTKMTLTLRKDFGNGIKLFTVDSK